MMNSVRIWSRVGLILVLGASLQLFASCSEESLPGLAPKPSDVDVDTPKLRAIKEEAGIEPCEPGTRTSANDMPDLELACLGGGASTDLQAISGPAVINFWYAACPPCRKEMPAIQEFHDKHGERVRVIGANIDVWPEQALKLAQRTGATYPQLADPEGSVTGSSLRVRAFPTFAFIAEDGTVTLRPGGVDSSAELVDLVESEFGVALGG